MTSTAQIPSETLAAIAAAVHLVLGAKARIVAVQPASTAIAPVDFQMFGWALEGRRTIHATRRVR